MDGKRKMVEVNSAEEIPSFANEAEEAEFWATHALGPKFLERMNPVTEQEVPVRPRTRPVAIRFDEDLLQRLKALAKKKGKGYQTLLKEFVLERLYEEEKREGNLR